MMLTPYSRVAAEVEERGDLSPHELETAKGEIQARKPCKPVLR